jgi:photosynthetic reaction center cytochrome c subunit
MKAGFLAVSLVVGVLLAFAMIAMPGWDRPALKKEQVGYRGVGMEIVSNPRKQEAVIRANRAPEAEPRATPGSPKASAEYKNVQVLGDLGVDEFNRLMVAITAWVSPQQGCTYCHAGDDLVNDSAYPKVVARRMLQMTKEINSQWKSHVGETGVTCYTCHRGEPVPKHIWHRDAIPHDTRGMAASRRGQNLASSTVGSTSLPSDVYAMFLLRASEVRVVTQTPLPSGNKRDIMDTEGTYGFMMHVSSALGTNCTACHNSRSFAAWDQSTSKRTTAFHGIRMARTVNTRFIEPLRGAFPANRLGPHGDVGKVNCATCHQGVTKPLLGANLLKDYPELAVPNPR